jgi:hypothetical protein
MNSVVDPNPSSGVLSTGKLFSGFWLQSPTHTGNLCHSVPEHHLPALVHTHNVVPGEAPSHGINSSAEEGRQTSGGQQEQAGSLTLTLDIQPAGGLRSLCKPKTISLSIKWALRMVVMSPNACERSGDISEHGSLRVEVFSRLLTSGVPVGWSPVSRCSHPRCTGRRLKSLPVHSFCQGCTGHSRTRGEDQKCRHTNTGLCIGMTSQTHLNTALVQSELHLKPSALRTE